MPSKVVYVVLPSQIPRGLANIRKHTEYNKWKQAHQEKAAAFLKKKK
jgi:hypothetical protein